MADKRIGDLVATPTLAETDVLEVDTGTASNKIALSDLRKQFGNAGQLLAPLGSPVAPGLAFPARLGDGMYSIASGDVGIATDGVLRLDVSTTAVTSALPITVPDGSVGAPGIKLSSQTTGLFLPTPTSIGLAVQSTQAVKVDIPGGGLNVLSFAAGSVAQGIYNLSPGPIEILSGMTSETNRAIAHVTAAGLLSAASGEQQGLGIYMPVSQTGTAAFVALAINTTSTPYAIGAYSGTSAPTFGSGGGLAIAVRTGGTTPTNFAYLHMNGGIAHAAVTPAALAIGSTADYAALAGYSLARISGTNATSAISGILAPVPVLGARLTLINVGSFNITINHQDAGSAAANRIQTTSGAATVLGVNATMNLIYDPTATAFWRQI